MTGILKVIEHLIKKEKDIHIKFQEVYEKNNSAIFTYFNQNSFNQFFKNFKLLKLINEFEIYQEGIGMYLMFLIFNKWDFERIDSTKVLEDFIKFLIDKNETVVFIGGDFEPLKFIKDCKQKKLNVELYLNGFSEINNFDILHKKLQNTNSRYIILGIGTPLQEEIAYNLKMLLPNKAFICVGNFINFFLGYQKRAPRFIRLLQLEWLFRFFLEPKRLFKRYIIGIPIFFFRIFLLRIKMVL